MFQKKKNDLFEKKEKPIEEEEGAWSGDDWKYSSDGSGEEYSDSEEDTSSDEDDNESLDPEERERISAEGKAARVATREARREQRRQQRWAANTSARGRARAARKAADLEKEQRMLEEVNRRVAAKRERARHAAQLQAGIPALTAMAGKQGLYEATAMLPKAAELENEQRMAEEANNCLDAELEAAKQQAALLVPQAGITATTATAGKDEGPHEVTSMPLNVLFDVLSSHFFGCVGRTFLLWKDCV